MADPDLNTRRFFENGFHSASMKAIYGNLAMSGRSIIFISSLGRRLSLGPGGAGPFPEPIDSFIDYGQSIVSLMKPLGNER